MTAWISLIFGFRVLSQPPRVTERGKEIKEGHFCFYPSPNMRAIPLVSKFCHQDCRFEPENRFRIWIRHCFEPRTTIGAMRYASFRLVWAVTPLYHNGGRGTLWGFWENGLEMEKWGHACLDFADKRRPTPFAATTCQRKRERNKKWAILALSKTKYEPHAFRLGVMPSELPFWSWKPLQNLNSALFRALDYHWSYNRTYNQDGSQ